MEHRIIKFMLICLVAISACYYDSEENLYPPTDCVTTNLSLQDDIVPILQRNCYVCHSAAVNTGNITLEGHSELMKHVNSGKLLGAIRHEAGFKPMPQGAAQLIDCDIAKIEQWIVDGSLNN
jgi:hypothetical protein